MELKLIFPYSAESAGAGGTKTKRRCQDGGGSMGAADAALLNLKISELTGTVYDLEQQIVSGITE